MKNRIVLAAMTLALAGAIPAMGANAISNGTVSGVITDAMCKGNHSQMMKNAPPADCVKACTQAGSNLVVMEDKTKRCYTLSDKRAAAAFSGKHVLVKGHIDDSSKMIHVHSLTAQ